MAGDAGGIPVLIGEGAGCLVWPACGLCGMLGDGCWIVKLIKLV